MRLTGTRAYYRPSPPKMPPGLVELMEGLTKDVLKNNPSDIYGFCAGHVQELLEKRDGPSSKKLLSVEEKIVRAQKKVRQRAEIRKQEYDKKFVLLQKQEVGNNDENDELTLYVPQLTTPDCRNANTVSDEDNATSLQEEIVQNVLKAPIHHEHALEMHSSEVEVSHESDSTFSIPKNNSNKPDGTYEIDNSKEENNANSAAQHFNAVQYCNETHGSQTRTDISSIEIPDIEITNVPDNHSEIKVSTDNISSDIFSENSIANEQSNENVKGDSAAAISTILDSDINVEEGIEKFEESDGVINDKNSMNSVGGNPALNMANIKDTHELLKSSENDDNGHLNTADSIQAKDLQPCENTLDIQQSNINDSSSDDMEQMQHSNNKITDDEEMPLSSKIENSTTQGTNNASDFQADEIQQEHHSNVFQDLRLAKDAAQTKNDGDAELLGNTVVSGLGDGNTNFLQAQNSEDPQGGKESINKAISESEAYEDLPPADVDKDIPTLVTTNTGNGANQVSESKSTTTYNAGIASIENMPLSQGDKDNAVLDKVTSSTEVVHDNTRLDTEDNSTDAIVNFSSDPAQNNEAHDESISKGEPSDNTSENIQNDNHDPSNMDLETAAITIQKVFRTFLFKSRGSTFEDTGNDEGNFLDEDDKNKEVCDFPITSALNIDRRAHGITRMDTVLQTVNEEKSLSLSDDSSTLSSAATIIQAHVRGFLVRNKLNSYKTVSTNSLAASNSNEPSITSLEADNDQNKNKTVLNIHIVPEGESYLSRDESLITSMELSLDSSPPSSINLHPLGYDKSERRKQLKREDAIQSISPPSNNSGKLSEDIDSVKELSLNDHDTVAEHLVGDNKSVKDDLDSGKGNSIAIENGSVETALNIYEENTHNIKNKMDDLGTHLQKNGESITKMSSDEMDVVTPFISNEESTLIHSGEFHDAVLPTRVSRSDTSVVSEFKNVLVYFLLWNHS